MFKPPLYKNKYPLDNTNQKWTSSRMSRKVSDNFFKPKAKHVRNKSQSNYSDGCSTCDEQNYENSSVNQESNSDFMCVPIKTPPKLDSIHCFGFNSAGRPNQRKTNVDKSKYKTEMCRQWSRNQTCSYGFKC